MQKGDLFKFFTAISLNVHNLLMFYHILTVISRLFCVYSVYVCRLVFFCFGPRGENDNCNIGNVLTINTMR